MVVLGSYRLNMYFNCKIITSNNYIFARYLHLTINVQLEKKSKYVDYIIVYMIRIFIISVYLIQLICEYNKTLWNFDMAFKKINSSYFNGKDATKLHIGCIGTHKLQHRVAHKMYSCKVMWFPRTQFSHSVKNFTRVFF
jgi:hypothetical protein